jgi:DNA-binding protein
MSNETKKADISEIFIGNKPLMRYVIATMLQIKKENSAKIKGRGKFISKAVDAAEVARKKLKETDNMNIKHSIKVGTDEFTNEIGKKISVSTIELTLTS